MLIKSAVPQKKKIIIIIIKSVNMFSQEPSEYFTVHSVPFENKFIALNGLSAGIYGKQISAS